MSVFTPLLAVLVVGASELQAQSATTLEITVRTAHDTQVLEGARVVIRGTALSGTTDRDGFLRIGGVPEGAATLEIRLLGYAPLEQRVSFVAGATTDVAVELVVDPIELDPVDAAAAARESNLARRGFYDRRKSSSGTFLTRDEIDRYRPRFLSDVLRRVGGIQVGSSTRGLPATQMRGQQTIAGSCPIQYYVDGVLTTAYSIDEMRPEDIDGIEIYRGAASIPVSFKRGTATCGVILLWSRVREN